MWSKVDDRLHSHPKVDAVLDSPDGLAAMGLWTLALSYCGDYLTDGHVTRARVGRLAGERGEALAELLVTAGLWETTEAGWLFHDYLEHNPSAADVQASRGSISERRSAAGKLGAQKRWGKMANHGKPIAKPWQIDSPDPDPDPDPDLLLISGSVSQDQKQDRSLGGPGGQAPHALKLFPDSEPEAQDQTQSKPKAKKGKARGQTSDTTEVLEHWIAQPYHGKRKPLLTPERHTRVAARLAEGFTVADLKLAVQGASKDPWLMGDDPRQQGKRYLGIETLLRDAKQVERLRDLAEPRSEAPWYDGEEVVFPDGTRRKRPRVPPMSRDVVEAIAKVKAQQEAGEPIPTFAEVVEREKARLAKLAEERDAFEAEMAASLN